jgi:hypothetical protein
VHTGNEQVRLRDFLSDEFNVFGIEKKGFSFVEAVTQCPIYCGSYALGRSSSSEMLR